MVCEPSRTFFTVKPTTPTKEGGKPENKGTVYATAPSLWRYPDFIMVNGTNYTDDGRGDLVYRNETGVILDLDTLGG